MNLWRRILIASASGKAIQDPARKVQPLAKGKRGTLARSLVREVFSRSDGSISNPIGWGVAGTRAAPRIPPRNIRGIWVYLVGCRSPVRGHAGGVI